MKSHCVVHVSFFIGFDFAFQTVPLRLSLAIVDSHQRRFRSETSDNMESCLEDFLVIT